MLALKSNEGKHLQAGTLSLDPCKPARFGYPGLLETRRPSRMLVTITFLKKLACLKGYSVVHACARVPVEGFRSSA